MHVKQKVKRTLEAFLLCLYQNQVSILGPVGYGPTTLPLRHSDATAAVCRHFMSRVREIAVYIVHYPSFARSTALPRYLLQAMHKLFNYPTLGVY